MTARDCELDHQHMLGDNSPRLLHVDVRQSPLSLVRAVTVRPVGFASLLSRSVLLIFTTAAMLVHKRSKAPGSSWQQAAGASFSHLLPAGEVRQVVKVDFLPKGFA